MATPIRKTFTPGEILTADDINGALNPHTANHIARGVASGTASYGAKAGITSFTSPTIPFNPGVFTAAPQVVCTLNHGASGFNNLGFAVTDVTKDGMKIIFYAFTGNINTYVQCHWIAVQT